MVRKKKIQVSYIIYCIFVMLPVYQDSPLSKYLGAAGYTLLMPLTLLVFFGLMIAKGKVATCKEVRTLFNLGWMLAVMSIAGILLWVLLGNPITVLGEFLPFKAMKVWLQYITYPMYVSIILHYVRGIKDRNKVFTPIVVTFVIITIICLIELTQLPYAFESLHVAGGFPYWRVRLLTIESSWTTGLIFIYFLLSIFYSIEMKKKIIFAVIMACGGVLFVSTGSKSLMMILGMCIIFYAFQLLKRLNQRNILLLAVSIVMIFIFTITVLPKLLSQINVDIVDYSSTVTRIYTIAVGFLIGCIFPVGIGGAVYLGVFPSFLKNYLTVFEYINIRFNLNEILSYINASSDIAVTVKSGIIQFHMYWGIVGTVLFLRLFIKLIRKLPHTCYRGRNILVVALLGSLVLLLVSSGFSFEYWLLLAFIIYLIERSELAGIIENKKEE